MQLGSGKIIHMADELSNVNGGLSTNDSIPVSMQQADVSLRSEGAIGTEINGVNNVQNPQQHSEYSRDYNVGSTSNAVNSMAIYRQQVEESHHDLVNLLTQQMTTILNPMITDHESRFDCLARQVKRIARIGYYDEGERHNARGNNGGMENIFKMKTIFQIEKILILRGGECYQVTRVHDVTTPLSRSQAIGVQWIRNCQKFQRRDHLYRRNPQWDIEHLLENNMPSIEGEPGVTQEAETVEGVSIKA
ncbi:hypothetical protein Ahy_B10g102774 [Arachis hypogaea]|uniref:Uncharacterized protein n=1 Tax=Arachis hypogaea TaxID=3818 RepID=A0A444X2D6_ARAHY|nr:hypothetical protein Ahy_B10g102774 [Arachis hypogaea]